jgi:hypothetical protein
MYISSTGGQLANAQITPVATCCTGHAQVTPAATCLLAHRNCTASMVKKTDIEYIV